MTDGEDCKLYSQWTGTYLTPPSKPVAGEILRYREIGKKPSSRQYGQFGHAVCWRELRGAGRDGKDCSAMSYECPPRVSVTLLVTDSEVGGWDKRFVVCRQYEVSDTIACARG